MLVRFATRQHATDVLRAMMIIPSPYKAHDSLANLLTKAWPNALSTMVTRSVGIAEMTVDMQMQDGIDQIQCSVHVAALFF